MYLELITEVVKQRLYLLYKLDLNRNYTPLELFNLGVLDACKVFIKQEPHTVKKILEGRFRLIFSLSIIDNCIAWLLCDRQNRTEKETYLTCPPQPGLSFTDEGISDFYNSIPDVPLVNNDVSGWDWSVNEDNFDFDYKRRLLLADGTGTNWERLLKAHYYVMARKMFVLSDGSVYAQVIPGVMPSGWKNTSATNSSMRYGERLKIEYLKTGTISPGFKAKTMGDDCVESVVTTDVDEFKTLYRLCGKKVTDVSFTTKEKGFEFCSHEFLNNTAVPLNEAKQLFNVLSYTPRDPQDARARIQQYLLENRNNPRVATLSQVIASTGWVSKFMLFTMAAAQLLGPATQDLQNLNLVLTKTPRDCTETCFNNNVSWMNSPYTHEVPNTMANKNKKKSNKLSSEAVKIKQLSDQVKALKMSKPKSKPFSTAGAIAGKSIGSMFGNSALGGGIGRWLGQGIGSIFGSGDYQLAGSAPSYNVLTNGKQIPKFSSTSATNIVCHREYLGDIQGTSAFNNTLYPLNPGINTTFPWLSTIAQNYQEYKFHGIVFEFRPLITDFVTSGAPGVVVMATNYNADSPVYATKQAMENSEFAVSVKPTIGLMHGVECEMAQTILPQRYVRTGPVPAGQDYRLYDYGNFQFATQSNPLQDLGELWVSYCVEFFKPILPITSGGDIRSGHVYRTNAAGLAPLGLGQSFASGSLLLSVNSNSISWNVSPGENYLININWIGTAATILNPGISLTGLAYLPLYQNDTTGFSFGATNGVSSTYYSIAILVTSLFDATSATITFGNSGVIPTASTCDIIVTQIDNSVVN